MKTQTVSANGRAHIAHAWQLFFAVIIFSLVPASKNFAQNEAVAQTSLRLRFIISNFADELLPNATASDDEFQAGLAPREVASNDMAGRPAEVLPCAEHARINENDSIPAAVAAPSQAPVASVEQSEQIDRFLVDKIQAVQRMIKLMELKEEIILEKARFQKELTDLQKKIENQ